MTYALLAGLSTLLGGCPTPWDTGCLGWGCCSYSLSFVVPRYFRDLSVEELQVIRAAEYDFIRPDGLAGRYSTEIDLNRNHTSVTLHNRGAEALDIALDHYLLADGMTIRPSKATEMQYVACREPPCSPDPERPVPTSLTLKPGETERFVYEFPGEIADYHEVTQRITVGPEPDDLILSRRLILADKRYNCIYGNRGHDWQPVEGEPAWKPSGNWWNEPEE